MFDRIKCVLYHTCSIFVLPSRVGKTYSVLSITAWMISNFFCYQFISGNSENFLSLFKEVDWLIFIYQENMIAIKLLLFIIYKFINKIVENTFLWQNWIGQIWNLWWMRGRNFWFCYLVSQLVQVMFQSKSCMPIFMVI